MNGGHEKWGVNERHCCIPRSRSRSYTSANYLISWLPNRVTASNMWCLCTQLTRADGASRVLCGMICCSLEGVLWISAARHRRGREGATLR